jgi:hypothetical protein
VRWYNYEIFLMGWNVEKNFTLVCLSSIVLLGTFGIRCFLGFFYWLKSLDYYRNKQDILKKIIRFNIIGSFVNDSVILLSCNMTHIDCHYYYLFDILRQGLQDFVVKSRTIDYFLKYCENISIIYLSFFLFSDCMFKRNCIIDRQILHFMKHAILKRIAEINKIFEFMRKWIDKAFAFSLH